MNSDTQLKVQAYLDNELSPGDARKIAALISTDRETQAFYANLQATKEVLRANEPEVRLEESREFYWSKIQRQIQAAEREPVRSYSRPWWVRLMAPVAGTAALFLLFMFATNPRTQVTDRRVETIAATTAPVHGEVEDLAPDVSSVTFRSEENGVTVVWLSARE